MLNDVSSRHLRNASELLVRVPIKQGFVPISEMTLSYASRLRMLLQALYELRRVATESAVHWNRGPIEDLETIFNSQWTVLEDDRELLITVSFDHSFEEYFQKLVRFAGPALDLIFCHCEGYADAACVGPQGEPRYQAFPEFVRRHQLACDFYYAGAPDLTVDDLGYLRKLSRQAQPSAQASAQLRVESAERELAELERDQNPRPAAEGKQLNDEQIEGLRKALAAMYDLRRFFPDSGEPDPKSTIALKKACAIFDAGVRNLVPQIAKLPVSADPKTALDRWIEALRPHEIPSRSPNPPLELDDGDLDAIQGNILTPYQGMTHGAVVLVRCRSVEKAGAFLKDFAGKITSQRDSQGDGPFANLALTYPGLCRLGLSSDVLAWFPKEFRQGMEQRAFALGDIGEPNHPDHWQLPTANWEAPERPLREDADAPRIALSSVDFVVSFQTRNLDAAHDWPNHPLHGSVAALEALGADVLHVQLLRRAAVEPVIEHFGFPDGGSQPVPEVLLRGKPASPQAATRDLVPLGELLLGYPDGRFESAFCADHAHNQGSAPLFQRGSFVVFRKLEQDVAAFEQFAKDNAADATPAAGTRVKEWTLGRAVSGPPLCAPGVKDNDFDYSDDPAGQACPMHAHVRRANPRVTENGRGVLPRIMRRGFSYGPRYAEAPQVRERGLMFMAYNASIAGQFEVIQRWLNGGNITGVLSSQNDLFTATPQPIGAPHWVYSNGWKALTPPKHPFVSLRWGLYAFAPARPAVRWLGKYVLARGLVMERDPELVRRGQSVIEGLQALERTAGSEAARIGWKNAIEEPMNPGRSAALWAAIRARGGVLETPYAVLVGHKHGAQQVLGGDGQRFSVREYWHRLNATTGEHYLAFDPSPAHLESGVPIERQRNAAYEARLGPGGASYASSSGEPNKYILETFDVNGAFEPEKVHERAHAHAEAVLARLVSEGGRREIALEALAFLVVARLCRDWFGMPDVQAGSPNEDLELAERLKPFVLASKFSFQPYPEAALTEDATRAGATLPAQTLGASAFASALAKNGYEDPEAIRRVMAGSIVGFAAPAIGCVLAVFKQWLERGELGRLITAWRAEPKPALLENELRSALLLTPIPPLLYRTAMPGATLAGRPLAPGQLVVVGLASAAIDARDWNWLFGGTRADNPHACPARYAALAAVTGIAAAVLEQKELKRERPLVVSFA